MSELRLLLRLYNLSWRLSVVATQSRSISRLAAVLPCCCCSSSSPSPHTHARVFQREARERAHLCRHRRRCDRRRRRRVPVIGRLVRDDGKQGGEVRRGVCVFRVREEVLRGRARACYRRERGCEGDVHFAHVRHGPGETKRSREQEYDDGRNPTPNPCKL